MCAYLYMCIGACFFREMYTGMHMFACIPVHVYSCACFVHACVWGSQGMSVYVAM